MKIVTTALVSLLSVSALALGGCTAETSESAEPDAVETVQQVLTATATETAAGQRHGRTLEKLKKLEPKELFTKLDSDGDGRIKLSELGEGHMERRLRHADLNGDGEITLEELTQAHAKFVEKMQAGDFGRHRPHGPPSAEKMLEHLDRDGDGKLSLTEVPEHFRDKLALADQNQDGVLDRSELEQHIKDMRAKFEADPEFAERRAKFAAEHPEWAGKRGDFHKKAGRAIE